MPSPGHGVLSNRPQVLQSPARFMLWGYGCLPFIVFCSAILLYCTIKHQLPPLKEAQVCLCLKRTEHFHVPAKRGIICSLGVTRLPADPRRTVCIASVATVRACVYVCLAACTATAASHKDCSESTFLRLQGQAGKNWEKGDS